MAIDSLLYASDPRQILLGGENGERLGFPLLRPFPTGSRPGPPSLSFSLSRVPLLSGVSSCLGGLSTVSLAFPEAVTTTQVQLGWGHLVLIVSFSLDPPMRITTATTCA